MDRLTQLKDWLPIRLYFRDGEPTVDWCYFGSARFAEPFYSETLEKRMRSPFNLLFRHQTSVAVLEEMMVQRAGVPPAGFIFHVSRCGSTLVSQMLASIPGNIVISEAPMLDIAITRRKLNRNATDDERIRWLRGLLNAVGQRRSGQEKRLFVKFDAWNILDIQVVRRAFPEVPWIFLYRDPVEVLVSQLNHRGAHMVPGVIEPKLFGLDYQHLANMSPEEYCAAVLHKFFQAGLDSHADGGRLVNYNELPGAVLSLDKYFGFDWTEEDINAMETASELDAKNPYQNFEDDRERKQKRATGAVVEASRKWLDAIYEQLETARLGNVTS